MEINTIKRMVLEENKLFPLKLRLRIRRKSLPPYLFPKNKSCLHGFIVALGWTFHEFA